MAAAAAGGDVVLHEEPARLGHGHGFALELVELWHQRRGQLVAAVSLRRLAVVAVKSSRYSVIQRRSFSMVPLIVSGPLPSGWLTMKLPADDDRIGLQRHAADATNPVTTSQKFVGETISTAVTQRNPSTTTSLKAMTRSSIL